MKPTRSAVQSRLVIRYYDAGDQPVLIAGPEFTIEPGATVPVHWIVPDLPGMPIFAVGFEMLPEPRQAQLYLDYLSWDGICRHSYLFRRSRIKRLQALAAVLGKCSRSVGQCGGVSLIRLDPE
jgi:hypothetical protein